MILQILFDQIQGYIQSSINSSFHSKFFVCLKKMNTIYSCITSEWNENVINCIHTYTLFRTSILTKYFEV